MSTTIFPESGDQITEAAWSAQNQSLTVAERYRLSGYTVSAGTGLNANVAAGTCVVNGYHIVSDGTQAVAVTASQTNYIWLNADGTLSANTTGTNPGNELLLGLAVTDGSGVTSVSHDVNIDNSQNVYIRKSADETVNNSSTLQDDNDLSFAVVAGEIWEVTLLLSVDQASATPNFKMAWGGSVGSYYNYFWAAQALTNTQVESAYTTGTMTAIHTVANGLPIYCRSFIVVTSTGTLTLQWAQDVATVANTILNSDSILFAKRVMG